MIKDMKKNKETFEEYMMGQFLIDHPQVLKDDVEDKFDIWMGSMNEYDYQDYLRDYKSLNN